MSNAPAPLQREPGSLRIGLTGGIGSGKSTVANGFASRGALIIDTDAISRSLTAVDGLALPAIATAFGPEMIGADRALDRSRMRALVFNDPKAKARLEALLHPIIGEQTLALAARAGPRQTIVFDVPLLVESGHWRDRVDKILVVDCDRGTQIARVMARSAWTADEVARVIAQQATREQRRAAADLVIVNQGIDLAALDEIVGKVWVDWGCQP